jgi:hypothetical protein
MEKVMMFQVYEYVLMSIFKCNKDDHGADHHFYNGIQMALDSEDDFRAGFAIGCVHAYLSLALSEIRKTTDRKDVLEMTTQCELALADHNLPGIVQCLKIMFTIIEKLGIGLKIEPMYSPLK